VDGVIKVVSCFVICLLFFGTKKFVYILRKPNAKEDAESELMPLDIIFQKIIRFAMAIFTETTTDYYFEQ
jgi:hypothetical protein